MLDPKVVLAGCGGDDALLRTMVESFQANVPGHLARVKEAVERRSPPELREAAHKLRGLVSAFSTAAAEAALRLEEMGACGQLGGAGEEYARLADMVRGLGPLLSRLAAEGLKALPVPGATPP